MRVLTVLPSLLLIFVTVESTQLCHKLSACSCNNTQGVIDLSPLARNDGKPAFKDVGDGRYKYSWNPCIDFNEGSGCMLVAGCEHDTQTGTNTSLGKQETDQFVTDVTDGLQIKYKAGPRKLYVTLSCDWEENGRLDVSGESTGTNIYKFVLHSKYACYRNKPSSSSVSPGSVLLIIFFTVVILYVVGGVGYQRFVKNESGMDLIPNYYFWSAIVGHIQRGFWLIFRCGKPTKEYSEI